MTNMTITGYNFSKEDYSKIATGEVTSATVTTSIVPEEVSWLSVVPEKSVVEVPVEIPVEVPVEEFVNLNKYRLYITQEFMVYHSYKPNWWIRMWQKLILGFRWEDSSYVR